MIVGGGLTGVWAALLAVEADPGRSVVLVEAGTLGWAASGRNGGFCSASLTHGLANGLARWPDELGLLQRLGAQNLDEIEQTVARHGIDCDLVRAGEVTMAVAPWQLDGLREDHEALTALGEPSELLDAGQARAVAGSPLYLGGLRDPRGTAVLDPARLLWGLADAAERLGVRIVEGTRVRAVRRDRATGDVRLDVEDGSEKAAGAGGGAGRGRLRARRVLLATNAFASPRCAGPGRSSSRSGTTSWPPSRSPRSSRNRWAGTVSRGCPTPATGSTTAAPPTGGSSGAGTTRSTTSAPTCPPAASGARRPSGPSPSTSCRPSRKLEGVRFSHRWAGAIDTSTRFTAFWQRALGGAVVGVAGYTGLGVGASRFGARVALDLLDGRHTERTGLQMVRRRPMPFPPEPARWAGITMTRRSIARADEQAGRRDLWLRTLDRLGLGFDS